MTDYRLTDWEIANADFNSTSIGSFRVIADAATKKARNETLKEVKAWLGNCGLVITHRDNYDFLKDGTLGGGFVPIDETNRFFPKEIE